MLAVQVQLAVGNKLTVVKHFACIDLFDNESLSLLLILERFLALCKPLIHFATFVCLHDRTFSTFIPYSTL